MELAVSLTLRRALLCIECLKALFHAGIVDAKELVLRGGHVDKVRLALAAFLIEELVHRLICRRLFQVSANDLVQRFPQVRRAAFGCRNALGTVFAGLIHTGIDARKSNDRTAARETEASSNYV